MLTWSGNYLPHPRFPSSPHQNGATVSPTHALFIPSHLNMKCLLLFPPSTHLAYVLSASFWMNGFCIPHLMDYWPHSHTSASVEKEASSSDKEYSDWFGVMSIFSLKTTTRYNANETFSLEPIVLKRTKLPKCLLCCPGVYEGKAVISWAAVANDRSAEKCKRSERYVVTPLFLFAVTCFPYSFLLNMVDCLKTGKFQEALYFCVGKKQMHLLCSPGSRQVV